MTAFILVLIIGGGSALLAFLGILRETIRTWR
jgi:hypothetical protein